MFWGERLLRILALNQQQERQEHGDDGEWDDGQGVIPRHVAAVVEAKEEQRDGGDEEGSAGEVDAPQLGAPLRVVLFREAEEDDDGKNAEKHEGDLGEKRPGFVREEEKKKKEILPAPAEAVSKEASC